MGAGGALVGASSLEFVSPPSSSNADVDAASHPSSSPSSSLPGSFLSHDAAEADEYRPGRWNIVDSSRGGHRSIFGSLPGLFASSPTSSTTSPLATAPPLLAVPDAATLADDWQHWSLTCPPSRLLAAILGAYAAVALLFAAALSLLAGCSSRPPSGTSPSPFLDSGGAPLPGKAPSPASAEALLWFSVTNLVTGGYGSLLPVSRAALIVATLEQLCGVLLASLTLGALVARAQLPRARLLFSSSVLLTARDGEPHLVFRVCSTRGSFAASPEIRARLVARAPPTAEGEALWTEKELVLSNPPISELKPLETLAHRIGSRSPLYGVRKADLSSKPRFVAVTISAVDADTRAPLFARHVYSLPRDVVWGVRFAEVLRVIEEEEEEKGWRGLLWKRRGASGGGRRKKRSLVVDLARFHETTPLAGASAAVSAERAPVVAPASASASASSSSSPSPVSARKQSAAALPSDRVRSGLERQRATPSPLVPLPLLPPKSSRPASSSSSPSSSSSSSSPKDKEWPLAEFGGAAAVLQQSGGGKDKDKEKKKAKETAISSAPPSLVPPPPAKDKDDGSSDEKLLAPLDERDAEACSRRAMGSLPSLVPPPPPPSPPPPSEAAAAEAAAAEATVALHAKLSRVSRAVYEESAALGLVEATPSMLASEEVGGLLSRLASHGAREAARAAVAAAAATPAGIAAAKSAKERRRPAVALPPSAFGAAAAKEAAPPARPRSVGALLPISPFSGGGSGGASSSSTAAASLSPRASSRHPSSLSSVPSSTGAEYGGGSGSEREGSRQQQQRPAASAAALLSSSPFALAAAAAAAAAAKTEDKDEQRSHDDGAFSAAAAASSPQCFPAPPISPFASCEIGDGDDEGGIGSGGEGGNLLVSGGQSLLLVSRRTVAVAAPGSAAATSVAAAAAVVEAAARLSSPCSSGGP